MKNLTEYIVESSKDKFIVDECNAKGNKKMGFMMYDEPSSTVSVIQFNKLEDFCEAYGFFKDDFMDIDKLEVGESEYDGVSVIYTRIW